VVLLLFYLQQIASELLSQQSKIAKIFKQKLPHSHFHGASSVVWTASRYIRENGFGLARNCRWISTACCWQSPYDFFYEEHPLAMRSKWVHGKRVLFSVWYLKLFLGRCRSISCWLVWCLWHGSLFLLFLFAFLIYKMPRHSFSIRMTACRRSSPHLQPDDKNTGHTGRLLHVERILLLQIRWSDSSWRQAEADQWIQRTE